MLEAAEAHGRYVVRCYAWEGGPLLWEEPIDNVVCTAGKNVALASYLNGSAYTVTGPFMGLISAAGFSAVSAADTMASHAGWVEAGAANAPTYSGTRPTMVWGTPGGGAISNAANPASFVFTGSGSVQGAFLGFGTGAVNTIGSTAGTLYSAGTFGTPQTVQSGNAFGILYTASL